MYYINNKVDMGLLLLVMMLSVFSAGRSLENTSIFISEHLVTVVVY
jgi:hypothetical protein